MLNGSKRDLAENQGAVVEGSDEIRIENHELLKQLSDLWICLRSSLSMTQLRETSKEMAR